GSTTFGPGTTGVVWTESPMAFCPGSGTGLERLPLCQDDSLAEPVLGTAYGFEPDGMDAVGSVTCHGIQVPVHWDCSGMTLLPSAFPPGGSGIARARSRH